MRGLQPLAIFWFCLLVGLIHICFDPWRPSFSPADFVGTWQFAGDHGYGQLSLDENGTCRVSLELGNQLRLVGSGRWQPLEYSRNLLQIKHQTGLVYYAHYDARARLLIVRFAGSEVELPFVRDD